MKYALLFFSGILAAQTPPAPANAAQQAQGFQQALKILTTDEKPAKSSPSRKKPPLQIQGSVDSISVTRIPALPDSALVGLNMSQAWLTQGLAPTMSKQGQLVYVYGEGGAPTVVCAMLQVCEIDLEPGETLAKDAIDWGDNRFEVAARQAGGGPEAFNYLVIKPTQSDLETTMTVGTNKRSYYIRLVSTSGQHMARISFMYPEEERKRKEEEAAAKEQEIARQAAATAELAALNQEKPIRYWKYEVTIHGKAARYLRPSRVGDDGRKTYIQLSEEARHHGLPMLQIKDTPTPANTSWRGDQLVVDGLFREACLVIGVGKKQQSVCLKNVGDGDGGDS